VACIPVTVNAVSREPFRRSYHSDELRCRELELRLRDRLHPPAGRSPRSRRLDLRDHRRA
jgi:hypothetical protein